MLVTCWSLAKCMENFQVLVLCKGVVAGSRKRLVNWSNYTSWYVDRPLNIHYVTVSCYCPKICPPEISRCSRFIHQSDAAPSWLHKERWVVCCVAFRAWYCQAALGRDPFPWAVQLDLSIPISLLCSDLFALCLLREDVGDLMLPSWSC